MFYNDKPGDWLLDGMVQTKACHLGRSHVSKSLMIFIIINLYLYNILADFSGNKMSLGKALTKLCELIQPR